MAEQETKKDFSEIISVDPISLASYRYAKNEMQPHRIEKSHKNAFIVSYIQSKDVISATVEISRNIPEADLHDAIEIKVYDELGLDSAVEYKITYLETETNDTKNRVYNVFVIDSAVVQNQLSEIQKKTSYIDYVTTAPFLIKSLYKKALLETSDTDCFIYFQKNDAFLTIYRGGEFLYAKSLHYSLTELTEKFCELIGERIDEEDFFRLLTVEGLKSTNVSYQSYLMQLFGELFLYINDVLIFAKRSYGLEHIDRVYIGSEIGMFIGIDEYAKSYLGLESYEFNFSIAINSKEWYIDQMHMLMVLTAQVYLEEQNESLNFSTFKRPPPFKQRPAGKLIGVVAASILLSAAFPIYQFSMSKVLDFQTSQATQEYNQLNKKATAIRSEIASLKDKHKKMDELIKKESDKLTFRKKLLTEIHKKKTDYPMKAMMMAELFALSNDYESKLSLVEFKDKEMLLNVQNPSEKKITEFIEALTGLEKYKISTDKIEKNSERDMYLSEITVGL